MYMYVYSAQTSLYDFYVHVTNAPLTTHMTHRICSSNYSVYVSTLNIFCTALLKWLETVQVNEAEEERMKSEREHMRVTQLCQEAEARVQELQKSLKRSIIKSKSYFELKAQFNEILEVCWDFYTCIFHTPLTKIKGIIYPEMKILSSFT